jgi:hypothetical protein
MFNKKEKQIIDHLNHKIENIEYISNEQDFFLTKQELLIIINFLRQTHVINIQILRDLFNKLQTKNFKK